MTREEIKETIKVMQAAIDCKTIQYKHKTNPTAKWQDMICRSDNDIDNIGWFFEEYDYRIKPEPTYQPYDVKTLTEAIAKHGYAVKTKDDDSYYQILKWKDSEVVMYNYSYTYKKFLEKFVWADTGEPCGVSTDNNE